MHQREQALALSQSLWVKIKIKYTLKAPVLNRDGWAENSLGAECKNSLDLSSLHGAGRPFAA